ncbi:hypothetical protein KJ951_02315 [Patescibacteria group bacterium]|nr:hypothetical protein [Patescibacteria group bacterium]MBU1703215.1 hypothetical protein [Patescibacteria group bacterium]
MNPIQKTCIETGKSFVISVAEQEYCRENGIPLPVIHPHERLRHMLYFRNRLYLYHTKCDFSRKPILSCVPPESGQKVYDIGIWESDEWDGADYAMEYDFTKSFFKQFAVLAKNVPWPNLALNKSLMENSDYTNGITKAKNCYLLFSASFNEDCMFSSYLNSCNNVVDSTLVTNSEFCYECVNVNQGYNLHFSEQCFGCSDSYFLYNCQACSNCFGCVNLRNKEYCFYNKQLSKEDYKKKIAGIDLGSYKVVQSELKKFRNFSKDFPIKYIFGKNIENSTGNNMFNVKNTRDSYLMQNTEDMENCIWLTDAKSSFVQAMFGNNSELVYNSITVGDNAYNIKFCNEAWPDVHDLEYCMFVTHGSGNCFGCVGLKRKQYCILNKQYSKEDYFDMVRRIKKQMMENGEYGQFFPKSMSPNYYNESEDNLFFPLTKEDAVKKGYRWAEEKEAPDFVPSYKVPDNIKDVKDDILETELKCEKTGRKFKIIKQELDFYRKNNFPIPHVSPMKRLEERSGVLAVNELHDEKCSKCGVNISTTYDAVKFRILCEKCYLKDVY